MKHKICLFDVTASHYRKEIFELIDSTFDVHFYFGDMMPSIKKMDTSNLHGITADLHVLQIGPFFWYKGMLAIVKSTYDTCIFDGDYRCLSTWISLLYCKMKGKRSFLWTHGFYGYESGLKATIKKLFFKLSTGGFIYGDYAKEIMINKYGIPVEKIHVIHNSLDYNRQLAIRKELMHSDIYTEHFGNDNPVLIFIGRLTKIKKLDMILSAQKKLIDNGVKVNLVYVGDGPEKKNLESLVNDYRLENNVWFYGASYEEEKNAELIYNADICISPGNIGLTALHVLTYGTPAITHGNWQEQMPEFEVITKGVTGDFFEYDSVDSLEQSIREWLLDDKNREDIRSACFNVIDSEWNPYYQIKVLKEVIDDE